MSTFLQELAINEPKFVIDDIKQFDVTPGRYGKFTFVLWVRVEAGRHGLDLGQSVII